MQDSLKIKKTESLLPEICVIIPAYNECESIGKVVADIPSDIGVREIIVSNNNSTDDTAAVAEAAGATVVFQPIPGYGNACLKAMSYLAAQENPPDIVVFLDGDYSDYPEQMGKVVQPIIEDGMDMVIGSRELGQRKKGAMMPQQIFGNWLATTLIRYLYGYTFTDLGPFRAIKWKSLMHLSMEDKTYGWTCEMQVKAARQKMKCTEVAVDYRPRIGVSKVTGTIKGTVLAGYKIIWTIFKFL